MQQGRTIVITGASSGFGHGLAQRLAGRRGHPVPVASRPSAAVTAGSVA